MDYALIYIARGDDEHFILQTIREPLPMPGCPTNLVAIFDDSGYLVYRNADLWTDSFKYAYESAMHWLRGGLAFRFFRCDTNGGIDVYFVAHRNKQGEWDKGELTFDDPGKSEDTLSWHHYSVGGLVGNIQDWDDYDQPQRTTLAARLKEYFRGNTNDTKD